MIQLTPTYRRVSGRATWRHVLFSREIIVLASACVWSLDSYFHLSPIYHLYVLFVKISYKARYCLQISPAILFTMLMGSLNRGIFIVHALLLGKKQIIHVVWFSCWAHAFRSFCKAHKDINLKVLGIKEYRRVECISAKLWGEKW